MSANIIFSDLYIMYFDYNFYPSITIFLLDEFFQNACCCCALVCSIEGQGEQRSMLYCVCTCTHMQFINCLSVLCAYIAKSLQLIVGFNFLCFVYKLAQNSLLKVYLGK